MAKFVKLTQTHDDAEIWINPDHVVTIEVYEEDACAVRVTIPISGESRQFFVHGSADQVALAMEGKPSHLR